VEDAARALELTNGTALEKDGQLLRVAFAKSIGPSSTATPSQGSAAAAAAIEAAIFSQQVLILYFCRVYFHLLTVYIRTNIY
jgi:RNA-binding protein 5/10